MCECERVCIRLFVYECVSMCMFINVFVCMTVLLMWFNLYCMILSYFCVHVCVCTMKVYV